INDAFGPDFLTQYDVAISFKASNAYSLYAWYAPIWEDNPSQAPNIDWEVSTASNDPDLSHGSIWYRKGDTTVSEPSTFALFGLGLLGLALVKRTKNHA
ncbi:MAG: PEP-CTERM sorting domain-containing protein, partial [Gammaproteobacteria bacterium]